MFEITATAIATGGEMIYYGTESLITGESMDDLILGNKWNIHLERIDKNYFDIYLVHKFFYNFFVYYLFEDF